MDWALGREGEEVEGVWTARLTSSERCSVVAVTVALMRDMI
jgi:hypothetical protein